MKLSGQAKRLRIYVGEGDRHDGGLLYEAIVKKARQAGLAGATVLRGNLGFGANSVVHSNRILRLSEGLPVVVEIVDAPERIAKFLPTLDELIREGLITLEDCEVIAYRSTLRAQDLG